MFVVALALFGCGGEAPQGPSVSPATPGESPLAMTLLDPEVSTDVRIERILALAGDSSPEAVHALLRVMRDRSQAAFLLSPDDGAPLGYRAVEVKKTGEDAFPLERVAAITALEKTGTHAALPDLLLALDDRNPVVQNHAARALVKLGNRSGIPVLLSNLETRILAIETAATVLREISGEDMGFNPDGGWALKKEAIGRWKTWWEGIRDGGASLKAEGRPYQRGTDPLADLRIAFVVDMLGQMQFLFHEQARLTMVRMGAPALSFLRDGVERARKTGNPTTRAGIAHVLAHVDHPNGRELLAGLLADSHPTVRSRAAESFGQLGGGPPPEALTQALADVDPGVRLAAVEALGRIGGSEATAAVRAFDGSDDRALATARTLALFEATKGVEERDAVLGMLLAVDIPTRNAAHAALVRLTGDAAGYDPLALEKDRERSVRRYRELLAR